MEFQFDPQKRRHVEGWNIICFDAEDRIGLTADEYERIAFDFLMNDMVKEAIKSYERAVSLGSTKAAAFLGEIYEKEGDVEEGYRWYLEGSLAENAIALRKLAKLYETGTYVRLDVARAEKLRSLADEIGRKNG